MEVLGIFIIILGVLALAGLLGLAGYWLLSKANKIATRRKTRKALESLPYHSNKMEERITFIIPFRTEDEWRQAVFEYLYEYYRYYFPEAEFIIAENFDTPFCKTKAVNSGFGDSHGDVIVMLDADCYIEPFVIHEAVRKIREARERGEKLWFIPYRRFYRLTESYTRNIMQTYAPFLSPHLPDPPPKGDYEPLTPGSVSAGHWFGALIQVYPWEAFVAAGGMDERFHGWGGEDVSFMHAVDTLWAKHKTLDRPVYHFWHPSIKGSWKGTRQWEGQDEPEMNDWLSTKYEDAIGDRAAMRVLVSQADDPERLDL